LAKIDNKDDLPQQGPNGLTTNSSATQRLFSRCSRACWRQRSRPRQAHSRDTNLISLAVELSGFSMYGAGVAEMPRLYRRWQPDRRYTPKADSPTRTREARESLFEVLHDVVVRTCNYGVDDMDEAFENSRRSLEAEGGTMTTRGGAGEGKRVPCGSPGPHRT
jgi:hypothetical protein